MKFRIIENYEKYYDKYEKFIKEYNKGTQIKEIQAKLKISNKKYRNYRIKAIEEKRIKERKKLKKPKYYYKTRDNKYIITKRCPRTRKMEYYGTVATQKEAEQLVAKLKKNQWRKIE